MPYLKDYTVGKGRLAFKQDADALGTKGKGFEDMGNCPELTLSLDTTKLEHFSSRAGLQKKDMEILTRATFMLGFTLDEPNIENLQKWFLASEITTKSQTAEAGLTAVNGDEDSVGELTCGGPGTWNPLYSSIAGTKTVGAAVPNVANDGTSLMTTGGTPGVGITATRHYEVRIDSNGTPDTFMWRRDGGAWTSGVAITGAAQTLEDGVQITFDSTTLSAVGDTWTFTVTVAATSSERVTALSTSTKPVVKDVTDVITYTEGAEGVGHYQVDYDNGIIYINYDQPALNPIALGDVLHVTAAWGATEAKQILALSKTTLKGHVLFVGAPPQGRRLEIGAYVSLKPTGDMPMISEDWMQVQFEAEVLEHADYLPGNIRVVDRGKSNL